MTFKVLKLLLKTLKNNKDSFDALGLHLINDVLLKLQREDEKHCKVIEMSLKLVYLSAKRSEAVRQGLLNQKALLTEHYYQKFKSNSNILAPLLKIICLALRTDLND